MNNNITYQTPDGLLTIKPHADISADYRNASIFIDDVYLSAGTIEYCTAYCHGFITATKALYKKPTVKQSLTTNPTIK